MRHFVDVRMKSNVEPIESICLRPQAARVCECHPGRLWHDQGVRRCSVPHCQFASYFFCASCTRSTCRHLLMLLLLPRRGGVGLARGVPSDGADAQPRFRSCPVPMTKEQRARRREEKRGA